MKIGIISDTHGDYGAIAAAVQAAGKVDLWLHAGDCCDDANYLAEASKTKVIGVMGNCDWPAPGRKTDQIIEAGGRRIFLTHGHLYGVNRGAGALVAEAAANSCDIAIYGHTHIPAEIKAGGVLVLNPGSVSRPRGGNEPSFAILDFADEKSAIQFKNLE